MSREDKAREILRQAEVIRRTDETIEAALRRLFYSDWRGTYGAYIQAIRDEGEVPPPLPKVIQQIAASRPGASSQPRSLTAQPLKSVGSAETQAEVWAIIQAEAKTTRREGETIEQAAARVWAARSDLVRRYREAPESEHDPARPAPNPWQGQTQAEAVYRQVESKAKEVREREPHLTKEQAFSRVWSAERELRERYYAAREADAQGHYPNAA